ncbi:hypothetical protein [Leptolyngbya sp. FACHB-261]|nr:hypothetical protein [Leptolyngbya sp. FACHB-261]MBD2103000.1 hypothetical protein [Leptolyngbya sp. FACHB-261]
MNLNHWISLVIGCFVLVDLLVGKPNWVTYAFAIISAYNFTLAFNL